MLYSCCTSAEDNLTAEIHLGLSEVITTAGQQGEYEAGANNPEIN